MADSTEVHLPTVLTRFSKNSKGSSVSNIQILRNTQTTRAPQKHSKNKMLDKDVHSSKRKRNNRYCSSESSDSGMASMTCSEASPWSSSGSDLTEPLSPLTSPVSPQATLLQSEEHQIKARTRCESLFSPERDCSCEFSNNKRSRRLSGESPSAGKRFSLSSLTANFKWLSYLWRTNKNEVPVTEMTQAALPVRFPVDQSHPKCIERLSSLTSSSPCLWMDCKVALSTDQSLLEHIQSAHVRSSSGGELYSCQWRGGKVQNRKSSSRTWLEKHVLLHGGHKPFRCIVDSCEQRFHSQLALERHVNAHLNSGSNPAAAKGATAVKIIRRSCKKMKNARPLVTKANPVRLKDYFDADVMERLRHQLLIASSKQSNRGFTVHNQIVARHLDSDGKSRVLLRWTPEKQLPDQWVLESQNKSALFVTISDANQHRK